MGFNRLIEPMDELASLIDEKVIIQIGCSSYEPRHAEFFRFSTGEHMDQLTRDARVIVSHAGSGSSIVSLSYKKAIVMVPRRHELGEHVDNHQLELVTALAEQNKIVAVYEPTSERLKEAIEEASKTQFEDQQAAELINALRVQVAEWHRSELHH
jgi:UDP-N-acetylglucosamine transferase subunit ALG13